MAEQRAQQDRARATAGSRGGVERRDDDTRLEEGRERLAAERAAELDRLERPAAADHARADQLDELAKEQREAAARAEEALEQEHEATEQAIKQARADKAARSIVVTTHQVEEIERVTANMPDGAYKDARIAELMDASPNHTTEQIRWGGFPPEPPPPPDPPAGDAQAARSSESTPAAPLPPGTQSGPPAGDRDRSGNPPPGSQSGQSRSERTTPDKPAR